MHTREGLFIGLIADGNRTWAVDHFKKKSKDDLDLEELFEAYQRGSERVKEIAERAREEGAAIFAVWGGSINNLRNRPDREIDILHKIYVQFLEELRYDWMDKEENTNVRFVHMGRSDHFKEKSPKVLSLIQEIGNHTKQRAGMVMAVCLDYDGRDEQKTAIDQWVQNGSHDSPHGYQHYLDLPRQDVEFQNVDLILRTSINPAIHSVYDNEFLHEYKNETRVRTHDICLPDFTADLFSEELSKYRSETQKNGK